LRVGRAGHDRVEHAEIGDPTNRSVFVLSACPMLGASPPESVTAAPAFSKSRRRIIDIKCTPNREPSSPPLRFDYCLKPALEPVLTNARDCSTRCCGDKAASCPTSFTDTKRMYGRRYPMPLRIQRRKTRICGINGPCLSETWMTAWGRLERFARNTAKLRFGVKIGHTTLSAATAALRPEPPRLASCQPLARDLTDPAR
jgi:hypothetical protein